jgi:hypothetical protein
LLRLALQAGDLQSFALFFHESVEFFLGLDGVGRRGRCPVAESISPPCRLLYRLCWFCARRRGVLVVWSCALSFKRGRAAVT